MGWRAPTSSPAEAPAPEAAAGGPDLAQTVFDEDWWLDTAAPGAWNRLEVVWDGVRVGAMAVHRKRRAGLTYLTMPHLTRTMSPVLAPPPGRPAEVLLASQAIVRDLVRKLPRHDRFERALNPGCASTQGFVHANLAVTHMYTFRSDPTLSPEQALAALDPDTRRNVRKSARERVVERSTDLDRFVRLHRSHHGKASTVDYAQLGRLFEAACGRGQAEIVFVRRADGTDTASFILLSDRRTVYAWMLARVAAHVDRGATSLLVFEALRIANARGLSLDLDGYVRPEVGVFMMKFGFAPVVRPFVNGASPLWRTLRAASAWLHPTRLDQHFRV